MSTAVLHRQPGHQQPVPSRGAGTGPARPGRSGPLLVAWAQALFTSDLSAHREHTRAEVASAVRHALGTHGGVDGCAAVVAAAYGEHPETAARRMRWARAVILGMNDFAAALGGAGRMAGPGGRAYLRAGSGALPVLVTPEMAARVRAFRGSQP